MRFAPLLEERFEAETGGERARCMAVLCALGFLFACLLYPVIFSSMSDMAGFARRYYFGMSMPFGFAVSIILWLRPPPPVREGLTLLANLVCIAVTFTMVGESHVVLQPMVVAVVAILMAYSAVGVQLRFAYSLAALLAIDGAYAWILQQKPDVGPTERINLVMMATVTAVYLMTANFQMERALRKSYLLALRERLQRQDLSERNLELDDLARRDALTGLANRRAYDAWLSAAWRGEAAPGCVPSGQLGLVILDVDRFKAYNDFYGHAAGDQCLKSIAVALREQLRGTTDLVARLGGEEFAVLLPGVDAAVCADIAERMREAVHRLELPHSGLGPHGMVTLSAGVASYAIADCSTPAKLFEAADAALYQAKISGRNRVCMATVAAFPQIASLALP